MTVLRSWPAFIAIQAASVLAAPPCPLLGPGYVSPSNIASNGSNVSGAWGNFTDIMNSYVSGNASLGGLDVAGHTFSVSMFSTHDAQAQQILQYHHTGSSVANSNTGVTTVDGDSVYRIGSLSKLLTVYLTLIKVGSAHWEEPVTKYLPELAAAASNAITSNAITTIDWSSITLGALAGQLGGLPRDISNLIDEVALELALQKANPAAFGLPELDLKDTSEIPVCGTNFNDTCTRSQFFAELAQRAPAFQAYTTPSYSNTAYELLGLALENVTGEAIVDMFAESMTGPLGMASTSYQVPKNLSSAVIPGGNPTNVFFSVDIGNETAAGGMFSTLNDLNRLGVSVLNSTLLSAVETGKWLKPNAHTSNPNYSVGKPWEIHRFTQPQTGRLNDLYSKEGDFGNYSSLLILSPDHDAGFSILAAGPDTPAMVNVIADVLADAVLVALESQAAAEAQAAFAGTYAAKGANGTDANTTMTLSVDPSSGPGIKIASWMSDGVDVLEVAAAKFGGTDVRLYPTSLQEAATGCTHRRAFRAVFGGNTVVPPGGVFTSSLQCDSWTFVDSKMYGKVSVDLFVFDIDHTGNTVAVSPAAWRVKLNKN